MIPVDLRASGFLMVIFPFAEIWLAWWLSRILLCEVLLTGLLFEEVLPARKTTSCRQTYFVCFYWNQIHTVYSYPWIDWTKLNRVCRRLSLMGQDGWITVANLLLTPLNKSWGQQPKFVAKFSLWLWETPFLAVDKFKYLVMCLEVLRFTFQWLVCRSWECGVVVKLQICTYVYTYKLIHVFSGGPCVGGATYKDLKKRKHVSGFWQS